MKLLLYSDNHFSTYSSIIRGRGEKYSLRLENQIKSLTYMYETASQLRTPVICLGDFFDSSKLTGEEITALTEINRYDMPETFLVGNHELSRGNLAQSTTHLFNMTPESMVIDKPCSYDVDGIELCFLPYILESERKPLKEYFGDKTKKRIILSHNDIAGVQMGRYLSKDGFTVEEIESCCDLFINGHLHNGGFVTDKIFNIGSFTGQNFSEDATKFEHIYVILDTETLKMEFYENPHAFNFYKISFSDPLPQLKPNAIVAMKVKPEDMEKANEFIANNKNIVCSRITIEKSIIDSSAEDNVSLETIDHIDKFREYVKTNLESINPELVAQELEAILK